MEAWRRQLNDPVSAFPIAKAGPGAHRDAEDVRPAARRARGPALSRRRAARQAPPLPHRRRRARPARPPDDCRAAQVPRSPARKAPKTPAFALEFRGRREARPDREREEEARRRLAAHAGGADGRARAPRPGGARARTRSGSARSSTRESRRLHALLRDQRLIAGIGRAWANEILHAAKLSPYALSGDLDDEEVARLAAAIHSELERGLELREAGASDEKTYRVHRRARRAVPRLRNAARAGRLRGAHDLLLPGLPDRRARPQGPPALAAAAVIATDGVVTLARSRSRAT